MSLLARLKKNGPSGFGYGSTAEDVTAGRSLAGKTYLVTGCNSGLGLETLRVLALRGAHVIGTARTVEKALVACASVTGGQTTGLACELADPISVRACVDAVIGGGARLDGILCNAGIMALPKRELAYGVELQLFTNHVGHFLLVTGLLDRLSDDGRVVMTSSDAHRAAPSVGVDVDDLACERGYSGWRAYGQSKIANILFARALTRRLAGGQRSANAVHPGVIATNLGRHMNPLMRAGLAIAKPLFLKTAAQGAATQVYVATHPGVAGVYGEYFADCNVARARAVAYDDDLAERLWSATEAIVARI
jgi:NAD(P)-dependent dehydrogenase (short-subunit alcohol dehydrogenase family)